MDNLNSTKKDIHSNEYNLEPVTYCKHCLSLNIRILDENVDYCDDCGSTDMETTDIYSWEKLYEERYKKPYNKK